MSSWSLPRPALRGALTATALTLAVALSAAMVRLLPWLLDPSVSLEVTAPFARSLAILALEASLAVGWPLGWALTTRGFIERGEARVLLLLGERPLSTVARLAPQALALGAALAFASFSSARQSTEPGRVVSELIAEGESGCEGAREPRTFTVPFLGATWLCAPDVAPRLAGRGAGPLGSLVFSARSATTSGDLGELDLRDVHLALARPNVRLHVDRFHVRGTASWGHASTLAPTPRALALTLAVTLSALAAVLLMLSRQTTSRFFAVWAGAAGPIAALGALRLAERNPAPPVLLVVGVPALAVLATALAGWAGALLPGLWHADSR
jgi:hypothetical protein